MHHDHKRSIKISSIRHCGIPPPDAIFCAPPGMSESTISKEDAHVSTHLFPAHMTYRHEHHNPESFLTVAGATLTVLVILIALAAAVAVAW